MSDQSTPKLTIHWAVLIIFPLVMHLYPHTLL